MGQECVDIWSGTTPNTQSESSDARTQKLNAAGECVFKDKNRRAPSHVHESLLFAKLLVPKTVIVNKFYFLFCQCDRLLCQAYSNVAEMALPVFNELVAVGKDLLSAARTPSTVLHDLQPFFRKILTNGSVLRVRYSMEGALFPSFFH